jgi:alpha-tubulin suppressor-like RCC1 family protein
VFFRSEDDSVEVGDADPLVAWAWYSARGDASATTLDSVRLTYRSLAPSIARVDSTGMVHATAPGTAPIVVTAHALGTRARLADGKADTVRIRVTPQDPALRAMRFVSVAASGLSDFGATCALTDDGVAWCWGYAIHDDASRDERAATFTRVAAPEPLASITVGRDHRCGVARTGRAYCWGDNELGQLGLDTRRQKADRPEPVAGNHLWRQVSAGGAHTCGVDVQGALFCWGAGEAGQLAPAAPTARCPASLLGGQANLRFPCALAPTPVLPRMRFREVATGNAHTCALAVDGSVWCWGYNYNHQASASAEHQVREPTRVAMAPMARIAAGSRHNCALDDAGRAYCWGFFRYGNVEGEDPGRGLPRPVRVGPVADLRTMSLGSGHGCAISGDGSAYCWGDDGSFALGSGTTRDDIPGDSIVAVAGGLRFRSVAAGDSYSCGVSVLGGLYCWGNGLSFRFAGGNTEEHPQPFRLAGPG